MGQIFMQKINLGKLLITMHNNVVPYIFIILLLLSFGLNKMESNWKHDFILLSFTGYNIWCSVLSYDQNSSIPCIDIWNEVFIGDFSQYFFPFRKWLCNFISWIVKDRYKIVLMIDVNIISWCHVNLLNLFCFKLIMWK